MKWVFFVPGERVDYPEALPAVERELAKRYTVYTGDDELPAGAEGNDGIGPRYVGGFVFNISVRRIDDQTIEVEYAHYVASLYTGRQAIRYRWLSGRWVKVWQGPQIVS